MSTLSAESFELLLNRLGEGDSAVAAENYELLRLKLTKSLQWKGCPESRADELADVVLDRVAAKIAGGVEVSSVTAYASEVMRFVWLEHGRRNREDAFGDESIPERTVVPDETALDDSDIRLRCLRKCLAEVVSDESDKSLIVGYYDLEAGDKLKDVRRQLAESMGMTMTNLKVKAFRLRDRLEKCINGCVERLAVTKTAGGVTHLKEGRSL